MKPPVPFLLAAAAVLTGAAIFHKNRADEHRARSSPANLSAHPAGPGLPTAVQVPAVPLNVTAPPPRPSPAAGTLMERVGQKLLATAKPEVLASLTAWTDDLVLATMQRVAGLTAGESDRVKAHLAAVRLENQRNSLRLDLTPAGRIAAQRELSRSSDAWLAEFLGEERFSRYEASRKARQRADAENSASRGLSRISLAVPLHPEQKDALYAGFVDAAMDPAAQAMDPLTKFRITSSISEEPGRPDIREEVKATLSPEQWAQYEEQARLSGEGQNQMTQHLMGMLPVLLSSLQELLAESAAAGKAK